MDKMHDEGPDVLHILIGSLYQLKLIPKDWLTMWRWTEANAYFTSSASLETKLHFFYVRMRKGQYDDN